MLDFMVQRSSAPCEMLWLRCGSKMVRLAFPLVTEVDKIGDLLMK